jgi:hypothetical protein
VNWRSLLGDGEKGGVSIRPVDLLVEIGAGAGLRGLDLNDEDPVEACLRAVAMELAPAIFAIITAQTNSIWCP